MPLFKMLRPKPKPGGKTIRIGTDVAALMMFHPADLSHRADHSIAWYCDAFAFHRESTSGVLLAFSVGSDGGYTVRLTVPGDGPVLTEAEADRQLLTFDFRVDVRHGALLLDNSDALPGEEQQVEPTQDMASWFTLPTGLYRARVHVLDVEKAASEGDNVTHVVAFHPVERGTWETIEVASMPPDLAPFERAPRMLNLVTQADLTAALRIHEGALRTQFTSGNAPQEVEALALASEDIVLPGESRLVAVSKEWFDAFKAV